MTFRPLPQMTLKRKILNGKITLSLHQFAKKGLPSMAPSTTKILTQI